MYNEMRHDINATMERILACRIDKVDGGFSIEQAVAAMEDLYFYAADIEFAYKDLNVSFDQKEIFNKELSINFDNITEAFTYYQGSTTWTSTTAIRIKYEFLERWIEDLIRCSLVDHYQTRHRELMGPIVDTLQSRPPLTIDIDKL